MHARVYVSCKFISGDSLKCNFEQAGFCDWEVDDSFTTTWRKAKQQTLTPNTGPKSDHTLGPGKEGNSLS